MKTLNLLLAAAALVLVGGVYAQRAEAPKAATPAAKEAPKEAANPSSSTSTQLTKKPK